MRGRPLSTHLAWVIGLCIVPLLLLAVWMARDDLQDHEARRQREGSDLARNQAISHENFLRARISALRMLADSPLADDPGRWPDLYAEARGFQAGFGTHVIFASRERRMRFNTRVPFGTPLPDLPLSKGRSAAPLALETGRAQVGDLVHGPVADIPLVAIVVPGLRDGRVAHLVLTTVEAAQLQRRLDQAALPDGWSLSLLDGTGAVIARRAPPGFDAARDVAPEGRFAVPVGQSAWSVVVEIPRDSQRAAQWRSVANLAGMILLATLLALAGGALASGRIRREVAALVDPAAQDARSGITEFAEARASLVAARDAKAAGEEGFRRLLAQAPLPLSVVSREGRFVSLNARFQQLLGYTREDLPDVEAWFRLAYPDPAVRERARENWRRSVAGEDVGPREIRVACKGGGHLDLLVSSIPQPEGMLALFIDITGQKQAVAAREVALAEHREARLAALNQMEDAQAARRESERNAAALQESRQQLRLLIDHAPAALAMFDREMRYLVASRRWRDDFGLGGRDIVGRSHYEVFPEIGEDLKAVHRRGLAGETHAADEDRFVRADGSVQWLRWEMRPWRTADGSVGGIVIFSEDITARRQAVEALRLNEEKLRNILDFSPDAVTIAGPDGRFAYHNRRTETLLGLTADELARQGIEALTAPSRRDEVRARFSRCLAGEAQFFESELLHKDGRRIPVEVNAMRLPDGTVIGEVRDISERKRAEAELLEALAQQQRAQLATLSLMEDAQAARARAEEAAESLRKLSQAVEQSPQSVVITNLVPEIEYVNEAFLEQTGYAREEVIGRNPRILHSGRTPPQTYAALWESLARGETWKGEFLNRRRDGSEYTELAVISPIRQADGRVSHYVAIKEDVTEKKRIGAELDAHRHHLADLVERRTAELRDARARAESANTAKSAFLANMSHEIRTPMNAVLGFAYLLRRTTLTAEQRDRLDKLGAAGEHLLAIINDILDLSKIEAGRLVLAKEDFSPAALLDGVRSLVAAQADAKGLSLDVECRGLPPWLRGDPTRLRQAVLNFAGNAVKFTRRGSVSLRARLERAEAGRHLVRFEVEDTGPGIPPDRLGDLFKAFEQVDSTSTRSHGGTGLGLAITKRLAELMDGEVGVQSAPDRGSRFWFTAWLDAGQASPPMADGGLDVEACIRQRHAGARILLAEDDSINQEVALALLGDTGLAVEIASDGAEAVRKAADGYDLVLMDVHMPRMDGWEATRRIRENPALAKLPVIAMTANAFDEDRERCLVAGMDDFVGKPVEPELLYAVLLRWLDRVRPGR